MLKNSENVDSIQVSSAPFSANHLNQIFQVSPKNADRLISRENGWLEFKSSFNWAGREEYARTIAAFANNRGGYLVFGVKDTPREILGIDIKKFETVDPTDISKYLNDMFDIEIAWEAKAIEFAGKTLLLLYVFSSIRKPVIASISGSKGHLVEGEIYYRYRGRTQRIRYAELQQLLEEQRRSDQASWLRLLRQIARVGIQNTGLVDLTSGKGVSPRATFVIDQALLPQLKFLKQGEFVETGGAPAVRLVGDATSMPTGLIRPAKKVTVAKAINTPDIVSAFLQQEIVDNPLEYVDRICFEASAYLPVYYFLDIAQVTLTSAIERLNSLQSTSPSKRKLIERLSGKDVLHVAPPKEKTSENGRLRAAFIEKHKNQAVKANIPFVQLKHALKALRSLSPNEIDKAYCHGLLQSWFKKYYGGEDSALSDEIRRAIAYVDQVSHRHS